MNKAEMDKLRSSILYADEVLEVKYTGKLSGFFNGKSIEARPRYSMKSNLPYPQPKLIACSYIILDEDGDYFEVANERYGKLYKGFEWVIK